MRRVVLAASAISFCLSGFPGSAQAGNLYRIRAEQKSGVQQDDGNWLFEEYTGIQKFDPSTSQWSSIFDGEIPTIKSKELVFDTSTQNTEISRKNFTYIYDDSSYVAASANNLYAYGEIYDENNMITGSAIYKFDIDTNTWTNYPNAGENNGLGSGYGLFSLGSSAGGSTDFSNLSINGVSVQGQIDDNKHAINNNKRAIITNRSNINNLGDAIAASTALGAALSALPVTPDDAPFSCGVGSGAYSSRFAMGLGCVAKLNQRLSMNAGGSHVFGGSSNYGGGSLDSVAWRGGFVLKLGKLDSPAATNEQLQSQLNEVKQENAAMKAKYSTIEEQNAVITQQNKALMARLERLEAIALGQQPAATTASLK